MYATRLITQLLSGTVAAISCPLSCGWLVPVTLAFGARIVPCQATPWVTANPVASGRFHISPAAVALPDRFMYIGAIDRIVSVVTLISAVAPGCVRLMTIPAAWVSWAALTVNTFRPVPVPVNSSACEYWLRLTVAPGVCVRSPSDALSSFNDVNSVSNENGGAACVSPPLTVKFGATSLVPP